MKTKSKKKARHPSKPRASSKTETQETETAPEPRQISATREAEPVDPEYAALVERGRAAARDMARSLWELGDLACE
jgi:hypothetical protein